MSEADITSAMAQAMDGEDRRRELAGQSPGLGALVQLPQPPSGAGVGISDVDMPVIGEGYDQAAEISAAVQKAYGEGRPSYADGLVGGTGFQAGRSEPAVRHVSDLGDGRLFVEGRSGPAGDPYTVISPPAAKTSLWARLTARLRRN